MLGSSVGMWQIFCRPRIVVSSSVGGVRSRVVELGSEVALSVRPVSVHPATTTKIVSPVLDRSSPNVERSFPVTT